MPIYEYECPSCGVIEVIQGINDKPLRTCPNCHRRKIRKLISESSFQLKGSGWYATDYGKGKSNGNGGHAKCDSGNGNGGNGNGDGKKDSAEPAAKVSEAKATEAKPKKESASKPASQNSSN